MDEHIGELPGTWLKNHTVAHFQPKFTPNWLLWCKLLSAEASVTCDINLGTTVTMDEPYLDRQLDDTKIWIQMDCGWESTDSMDGWMKPWMGCPCQQPVWHELWHHPQMEITVCWSLPPYWFTHNGGKTLLLEVYRYFQFICYCKSPTEVCSTTICIIIE